MAQHDYVIANGTGAAVRSDINNGLAAIVSNNSGTSEPATMYAYQWWADTTTGLLKIRNAANNAWVTVGTLADANLGLLTSGSTIVAPLGDASTPGITFTGDLNTGIFSPTADQLAISTSGTERVEFGTAEVVFNDGGANYDFRIEGDTNSSLFFVDASAEAVGIGTTSPSNKLHLSTAGTSYLQIENTTASNNFYVGNSAGSGIFELTGSNQFKFISNSSDRVVIDSSGRLLVGTTTATANGGVLELSGGITFPATAVAASDANTLDDYEEGTWTPSVTNMTTTGSPAYGGRYRKIGSQVTIWFFTTTAGGVATYTATSNSTSVAGLPFTSGYDGTAASGGPPGCAVNGNTTDGGFLQGPNSGSVTFFFGTTIAATQGISASLTYYV